MVRAKRTRFFTGVAVGMVMVEQMVVAVIRRVGVSIKKDDKFERR